jgi:1,4-alpha-glucan branching enzyme
MPKISKPLAPQDVPSGAVTFRFDAFPRETIYVAGSFNNWDPFMYVMKEKEPGHYELILNLPPGTYQYIFFYRGERHLDQNNLMSVYRDGRPVSQTIVQGK